MNRVVTYIGLAALVSMAAACADVRASQPATPEERDAARSLLRQLSALAAQPEAASELLAATSAAPLATLLAPEGSLEGPGGSKSASMPTFTWPAPELAELASGCVSATPTSATFSLCEIGSHAVEGTWSIEGHRVHTELVDVFVADPELHGSVAVETHIDLGTMNRPVISGALDANIIWSTEAEDVVIDASLRIDDILLDGPDCASGGSITIVGAIGDGPRTTTSLWFGPGCADIQIAR